MILLIDLNYHFSMKILHFYRTISSLLTESIQLSKISRLNKISMSITKHKYSSSFFDHY